MSSDDSISWNASQVVNDALAQFRGNADMQFEQAQDEFLSVTGSQQSVASGDLNNDERLELEYLRSLVAGLQLDDRVERGSFWNDDIGVQNMQPVQHLQPVMSVQQPVMSVQQPIMSVQQPILNVQQRMMPQPGVPALRVDFGNGDSIDRQCVGGMGVGEGAGGTSHTQPSLVPREVKLAKPSTFSGKKVEVDNFIFEMRQYVDSVGLGSGSTACRFVVSHLKGDALTWWRAYSKDSTRVFDTLDLDDLLTDLRSQFTDIDEEMKLRDKLLGLRQSGTVTQYVTEFKNLQLKLGVNRLDDVVALHVFQVGLKPQTREKVLLERPDTFEDAVILAERAEQNFLWRQSFGGNRGFYRGNQRGVSQYSNSRYKGPAPMVLGHVSVPANTSRSAGKATVTCYHCGKTGHYKRDCWKLNGKSANGKSQFGGKQKFGGNSGAKN